MKIVSFMFNCTLVLLYLCIFAFNTWNVHDYFQCNSYIYIYTYSYESLNSYESLQMKYVSIT